MRFRLLNANKMIRSMGIQEVISHNLSGPGTLFDPNIFGTGDMKTRTFGYIRLHGKFVHPLFFILSSRLWRDLPYLIDGRKKFKIVNGDLVLDPEGETGLDWLYENFDKLSLKKLKDIDGNKGTTKKMKMAYDKLTRDDFFIDKLIVIPQHFRDVDTLSGNIRLDELNQYYIDLIKATRLKEKTNGNLRTFFTDVKIQGLLVNIFKYFGRQHDKNGLQRKAVMGRAVDNSIRCIIVAPEVRMKDVIGKGRYALDNTTIPLHHFLNGAPVHALNATRRVLNLLFEYGKFPNMNRYDFDALFSDEYIKKNMENYSSSHLFRLKPVLDHKDEPCVLNFEFIDDNGKKERKDRSVTWCDIFYLAVQQYKDNLRAIVTRYPVIGKDSNIFLKPDISVFTEDQGDMNIYLSGEDNDPIYSFKDNYPNIEKYMDDTTLLDRAFDETARFSNMYLGGLDGDYDGDKTAIRLVYSKEAREAVDKICQKPISVLNVDGTNNRTIGKEGVQALYSLTLAKYGVDTNRNKKAEELLKEKQKDDFTLGEVIEIIDKFSVDTPVQWKGKFTTVGRVLFNEIIFNHIKEHIFVNEDVTKKVLNRILNMYGAKVVEGKLSINDYKMILNKHHDLAFGITDIVSPGVSINMLVKDDKVYNKKKEELWDKYKHRIEDLQDTSAMDEFEKEMLSFSKEYYKDDPMVDLYNSGAGPGWEKDFKNLKISMGNIPDPGTGNVVMVKNNLKDGLSKEDIAPVANLQIYGAHSRAAETALGGYMVKRLVAAFQSVYGFETDCGSDKYNETIEHEKSDLLYRYIKENGKEILLTPEIVDKYVGKKILVRSPIFCKHKKGYCSKCLGEMLFMMQNANKVNIGLSVPIVGSRIQGAYMKKTHDMGVKLYTIKDLNEFVK